MTNSAATTASTLSSREFWMAPSRLGAQWAAPSGGSRRESPCLFRFLDTPPSLPRSQFLRLRPVACVSDVPSTVTAPAALGPLPLGGHCSQPGPTGAAGDPHHLKADQSQLGSTWARDLRYRLGAQDVDARRDHNSAGRGRRFWVAPIHTLQLGHRSGDHRAQPLHGGCLRGSRMGGGGSRYGQAFWPQDPWVLSTSSAGGGAATGRSALHAGHGGSRSCPQGASVSNSQSPHGGARGLDGGTRCLQSWGQSRAGCTHFDYKVLVRGVGL